MCIPVDSQAAKNPLDALFLSVLLRLWRCRQARRCPHEPRIRTPAHRCLRRAARPFQLRGCSGPFGSLHKGHAASVCATAALVLAPGRSRRRASPNSRLPVLSSVGRARQPRLDHPLMPPRACPVTPRRTRTIHQPPRGHRRQPMTAHLKTALENTHRYPPRLTRDNCCYRESNSGPYSTDLEASPCLSTP